MFNHGVPSFYNPKLDNPTRKEKFLKGRRMRIIEKIKRIEIVAKEKSYYQHELRMLKRKLAETEAKLGIKP